MHKIVGSMLGWLPAKRLFGVDRVFYSLSSRSPEFLQAKTFSHAIATPMTSLLIHLESCLGDPELLHKKAIHAEIKALSNHVKVLFQDWAHLAANATKPIIPDKILKQAILVLGSSFAKQVSIQSNLGSNSKIHGSAILFQEILVCLFRNAYEAYPAGSTHRPISCLLTEQKNAMHIDIVDAGSGMNILARLVAGMPGITFKERGTGIGLYMARESIQKMFGGELRVYSTPGVGTRVTIKLPMIPD